MAATTQAFADLLDPTLRELFDTHYADVPTIHEKLFIVEDAMLATEWHEGMVGPALMTKVAEGEAAPKADAFKGFRTTFDQETRGRAFDITWRMARYNLQSQAFDKAIRLGQGAALKIEKDCIDIFNNAETALTGAPNSEALVADSHAVATGAGGSAQDNKGTTALSHSALVSAITAMRKFTDDQGEAILVLPKILLVPVDLEATALGIVKGLWEYGSADRNVNTIKEMYAQSGASLQVLSTPLLTDTNNWFLVDPAMRCLRLKYGQRPELRAGDEDESTRTVTYRVWADYDYGYIDWRGVYGSIV